METEKKNLQQIMAHRLEKLQLLLKAGHNPYPYNFDKTHLIKDLIEEDDKNIGNKVKTAGRIVSQRKMGKASFIHIQDESNKLQAYAKNDILPDGIYDNIVRNLDLGDIIGVKGILFRTNKIKLEMHSDNM